MDASLINIQKFLGWSEAEAREASGVRVARSLGLAK